MNPAKVDRARLVQLTDLPNVGPSLAKDLRLLGYQTPQALAEANPVELYQKLCQRTSQHQDPCVLDVFLSITDFLAGNEPRPWWMYTNDRKNMLR